MARVSEASIERELDRIAELLQQHPGGLSRHGIGQAYKTRHSSELSPRTLQRRLEKLVSEGKVRAEGEGRRTVYRSRDESGEPRAERTSKLSAQGARLRELVRRPIHQRAPVGYAIEYLRGYKPAKTWYLSKGDRSRLRELGTTSDEDRPGGTFARDILGRLLVDLSWASSRLEGNTYSRLDTQNLLEFGQTAEGKDASETQMILNHKAAIEYIVDVATDAAILPTTVLAIHALLSENLLDDASEEGRLRTRPVDIGGSSYVPTAIPQVIAEAFQRIIDTLNAIPDPFEQALFSMVQVAYLQPFIDVNKRTSRLVANLCLIRANMCPLSFVGADEEEYVLGTLAVYENRRTELLRDFFLQAYQHSAAKYTVVKASVPTPDPLRLRYRDQLRGAIQTLVQNGQPPSTVLVHDLAVTLDIRQEDQRRFEELVLELLLNLNEGSAARYDLRPSEFHRWKDQVRKH